MHVEKTWLVGSAVRNDFFSENDIDIIVEFNRPVGIKFINLRMI